MQRVGFVKFHSQMTFFSKWGFPSFCINWCIQLPLLKK
jgi:hypothetical protein